MGRAFKTKGFTRAARKAAITDDALCKAIKEVAKGQADDLGGGVFKKRLKANAYRAIILLMKGADGWVCEYLFAKKDRANIEDDELAAFRKLAKAYAGLNAEQIEQLIIDGHLTEISREEP